MSVVNFLIGFLLPLASYAALSPTDGELLRQAECAFQTGIELRDDHVRAQSHFREAARICDALRERGVNSAGFHRNAGNACFLAGDVPRAILAYRRGLSLDPGDALLRANLAYAREQVPYSEQESPGRSSIDERPVWLLPLAPRCQRLMALLFYSVGWLTITRWLMVRTVSRVATAIVAFAVAAVLTVGLAAEEWRQRQDTIHPPVVIADDGVCLRKGNGVTYPRRSETPLHRGMEARLLFARDDWLQIELPGGQIGWIPRTQALLDTR